MRWLGIDLGERRIGLAVSDPLEITAQSHSVRHRDGNLAADLDYLGKIIRELEIEGVVLGLPRNMNGSEGPMAEKVRIFGKRLAEKIEVPVVFWDERLSTRSAERILLEADLSRQKRKQKIDQLAASIILQNFLEARARSPLP